METETINPKAKLLLGAGQDLLHFETQEWLDSIDFWKDEIRFFENLLNKKKSQEESIQEYSKMLKSLDKIHADLFKDIEDDILEHEKLLSRLVKVEKGLSDADYREQYQSLTERMNTFTNNFKTFKRIVFEYAKNR